MIPFICLAVCWVWIWWGYSERRKQIAMLKEDVRSKDEKIWELQNENHLLVRALRRSATGERIDA